MTTASILRAFLTVFPAELPDKTMIASVMLVARYRRPGFVWLGAVAAFAIHVTVAVAAGSVLSLLPDLAVDAVVTVLFAAGAALLLRAARAGSQGVDAMVATEATPLATLAGSFALVLGAEWGDLTQLATASLAAESGEPLSTALGAWVALAAVAAIAATFGRQLIARVPLHRVNFAGAVVFAGLAVWTASGVFL